LRRFFAAASVRDIPGLRTFVPPQPAERHSARDATESHSSVRLLSNDEVTRFLIALREGSATWDGDRTFTFMTLVAFNGIYTGELMSLRRLDVRIDRSPSLVNIAGRNSPVLLNDEVATILRRWLTRPDQIDSLYVFPGRQGGRWSVCKGSPFVRRIRRAADRAGITARVKPTDLIRFHERCAGNPELGAAWRDGLAPEPIATGPQPKKSFRKLKSPLPGEKARPDLAGWAPDTIPAVQIMGEDLRMFVCGVDKGVLNPAVYRAVKLLADEFPGGLSRAEMNQRYEGEGWRQLLIQLMKDPDWARAIGFPKKRGDGLYRILPGRPGPAV
jgi:hypothetical protein